MKSTKNTECNGDCHTEEHSVTVWGYVPEDASESVKEAVTEAVVSLVEQQLLEGVEKMYSTSEAAQFFGKSNQWLYWGMRQGIFTDIEGNPITPARVGNGGRRRFTLPVIREMALSCYRRGNLKEDGLREVFKKILIAEYGEAAFEQVEVVDE